ncbi:MAG: diacylglycerol kinase [Candidatus Magasanikbacteria bacterium]|nr:diacylglycerol kinase [Candidatus Magasanikbacteria bacterium]
MSLKRLLKSFKDAFRGLKHAFWYEQNFRIQFFSAFVVLALTLVFPLKVWEVIILILLVVAVLAMELLNTALEYFADLLKPRLNHYVSVIKDIMAAAVLITSLGALAIGLIIFLPHFIALVK